MIIEIEPLSPFDFSLTLDFLKRSPHEILHHCDKHSVTKAIDVNGTIVPIQIFEENGKLKIDSPRSWNPNEQKILTGYVEDWFDLKTDILPFYKMAKRTTF